MRILFMGNPEFAVASLKKIHEAGYNIVAVVTGADKPAGRGLKMQYSPVKEYALLHGLKVLQPEKLKDPAFIQALIQLQPDLGVVIAFRMLPELVWQLPRLGTVNLHSSLLPQYRGAAPINWAIINGEKETGLTTFFLKQEIDTGNIIFNETITIDDDETAGSLHDRMKKIGADLMLKTLNAINEGDFPELPQPHYKSLRYAPKIYKPDCKLDFNQDIDLVYNKIRGLSPYPAAFTLIDGRVFKIYMASKDAIVHNNIPGTFIKEKNALKVAVINGYIHFLEVQIEGKKRMGINEFLNGHGELFK